MFTADFPDIFYFFFFSLRRKEKTNPKHNDHHSPSVLQHYELTYSVFTAVHVQLTHSNQLAKAYSKRCIMQDQA